MHAVVKGGHHGTGNQEARDKRRCGAALWDPFAEMRAEIDRVFNSFLGRGLIGRASLPRMTMPEIVTPEVDVSENDKEIVFEAELPGMSEKDVSVMVRN